MSAVLDTALSYLFPQRVCCHGCGCLLTAGEGMLCNACQTALQDCTLKRKEEELAFKPEQLSTAAAYAYDGLAADLVRDLKFMSDRAAALPLAEGMAARYIRMPKLQAADVCVAVPSHPRQIRKRGYAQAQVLCDAFTQIIGMAQAPDALARVRQAASQVGKTRDERKKQIVGAFVTRGRHPVRGRSILMIDDVLTTGATACECARVLYAAGALRVLALTACRA